MESIFGCSEGQFRGINRMRTTRPETEGLLDGPPGQLQLMLADGDAMQARAVKCRLSCT